MKEIEVKIKVDDFDEIEKKLNDCKHSKWVFEDNFIYDRNGELKREEKLLRIRIEDNKRFLLTLKNKKVDSKNYKIREEYEVEVKGDKIFKILENLGYSVFFRYQKKRKKIECKEGKIFLDKTPIGNFIEIEAQSEELIDFLAKKLGFTKNDYIKDTYYSLFKKVSVEKDMVF